MTQYDPPPQIAEFNYIWQRWLNSLFILVKGSVQKANPSLTSLPVYANNAAAITGGLSVGQLYRTGANPDPVCVVH